MAYYRNRGYYRKPQVRSITVKYAGPCACCGGMIQPGAIADYYPVGTIAGVQKPMIAHVGGLDGNSRTCTAVMRQTQQEHGLNDYAGDGLDSRYEDDCQERTGA